jgi:hypothetical protein
MIKARMQDPLPFYRVPSEALDGNGNTVFIEISGVPFYDQKGLLCG